MSIKDRKVPASRALRLAKRHDHSAALVRYSASGSHHGDDCEMFRVYCENIESFSYYIMVGAGFYVIGTGVAWARFQMDGHYVSSYEAEAA